MFANKHPQKEVAKGGKIFRPWDHDGIGARTPMCLVTPELDESAQDATISTTTAESEDSQGTPDADKHRDNKLTLERLTNSGAVDSPKGFKRVRAKTETCGENEGPAGPALPPFLHNQKASQDNPEPVTPFPDYPASMEGFPLYSELIHVNLAHSLGLTPTDPLFLEYVNQGCTLEEYTRVVNQEHQAKILSARKQRPKKYRCPHCDVGFSNNGQLKGHIRIHTGERPFRCDEKNCGKTFTRNEELTRHKRIHSGLRPFPCSHCGKRFGRKDHLKKHSRTHFQPRGLYAVPVMLPFETWTAASTGYPYVPMFTY